MDLNNYLKSLVEAQKQEKKISFEAHYWGKFKLVDIENTPKNEERILLATSNSAIGKSSLVVDLKQSSFYLPKRYKNPISNDPQEFFGDFESFLQKVKASGMEIYFDCRQKLECLIPPEAIYNTKINDPEAFDEVETYHQVIAACRKLAAGRIEFDRVLGRVISEHHKVFEFHLGENSWQVDLTKELFDKDILTFLNEFTKLAGFQFAHTINSKMEMLILKLDDEQFEELERRGLLI